MKSASGEHASYKKKKKIQNIRFIYFQFTELKVFERVNTCTQKEKKKNVGGKKMRREYKYPVLFNPTPVIVKEHFRQKKKKKQVLVLLKTPFCVLVAYLLRTCCALCARKKKYRNTLYCVVVAYLVFFISGAPGSVFFSLKY